MGRVRERATRKHSRFRAEKIVHPTPLAVASISALNPDFPYGLVVAKFLDWSMNLGGEPCFHSVLSSRTCLRCALTASHFFLHSIRML
jgi:hypothetical protein